MMEGTGNSEEQSAVRDIPAYHCVKMGIFAVQQDASVKHKLLFVLLVSGGVRRQLHMQMLANLKQLSLNDVNTKTTMPLTFHKNHLHKLSVLTA